ncbi:MAG: porin [Pseudomonadales bacterium]|nr:porin [Pseudomonadales bacterium]
MDKFQVYGFADIQYVRSDHESMGDTNGSFDVSHFNVMTNYQVNSRVSAKIHLEYERSSSHVEDHAGNEEEQGEGEHEEEEEISAFGALEVVWAYIEFDLSHSTRIRTGKNLTPFGIFNEIHDASPSYNSVDIPSAIYRAGRVGGMSMFPEIITGIFILADHQISDNASWNYVAYVGNGEHAEGSNIKDENVNKIIGGRIAFSPTFDIHLSSSFLSHKVGEEENNHESWIVSLEYAPSPFEVHAEYAISERENLTAATVTESSWYMEAAYTLHLFTPFMRYGWLDPDDDSDNDEWTETVIGSSYHLMENTVLKFEYRIYQGDGLEKDDNDYNEVAAAVTVAF